MNKTIQVLILEDRATDAEMLVRELRRAGYEPQWKRVETETDFLAEIAKSPDIILSDYSMPRFDGLTAAKLLQKSGLDIPFILISGTVGEDTAVAAMKMGVTDYLLKDRLARLGQAVEHALITAKKRGEHKKAEQQILLQTRALEVAANAILITDRQGKIVSANLAFCAMTGYALSEVLGQNPRLLKSGTHDAGFYKQLWQTICAGDIWRGDIINRRKDGTLYSEEMMITPVRSASGEVTHFIAIKQDITERIKAEDIVHNASRRETGRKKHGMLWDVAVISALCLLAVAGSYSTGIFQSSFDDLLTGLNGRKHLDELFVAMAVMVLGFFAFFYRRWREVKNEVSEQLIVKEALGKLHQEMENRVQQRTAQLSQANDSLQAEVAERKRAEDELRLKTAFLEAQVNSSADGILVVNDQNRVILRNRRLMDLFDIPEEIARDDDDTKMLRYVTGQIKDPEKFLERVKHLYAHPDEVGRDEIVLVNGTILDRYSSPVRDGAGKYYGRIWAFHDLTERRKLEDQFRQAQKMEGIGQLAGGVAHDFNNILGIILLQADILRSSGHPSPKTLELATEIIGATERAAALTRQLLLFSRKETMRLRDLDLNQSITSLAKMLGRTIGEHVVMQFQFAGQPLLLHADAGMLDQVLINLAVNARDAMPGGGRLLIKTEAVEFDESIRTQTIDGQPGSFACLSVSDTGCGIPAENIQKIFEPFFTTKEVGKGTGLGLSTVFGIVRQHGGWVSVYSEVGCGTTFRLFFPRLARPEEPGQDQPVQNLIRGGNETILVVEDDVKLRSSVHQALSQLGYRVLEAADGVQALQVWKRQQAEIQLVLTDLVMPGGINGKQLAEQLWREQPKLKVIFASGYSAEVAGPDFHLEEGVNFLTKPYQARKLAQTVREVLDAKPG